MRTRPVFVPNGESRQDTAILLVGTAHEFGISQRSISATPTGFWITEDLAAILYDEDEQTEPPAPTKTSGTKAAKKNSKEE